MATISESLQQRADTVFRARQRKAPVELIRSQLLTDSEEGATPPAQRVVYDIGYRTLLGSDVVFGGKKVVAADIFRIFSIPLAPITSHDERCNLGGMHEVVDQNPCFDRFGLQPRKQGTEHVYEGSPTLPTGRTAASFLVRTSRSPKRGDTLRLRLLSEIDVNHEGGVPQYHLAWNDTSETYGVEGIDYVSQVTMRSGFVQEPASAHFDVYFNGGFHDYQVNSRDAAELNSILSIIKAGE